jgi:hypothetical protein
MTAKIVQSFKTADPSVYVFLYRNSEWQEWSVCIHKKSDTRHNPESVYFASDKQDALAHAAFLVANAEKYA